MKNIMLLLAGLSLSIFTAGCELGGGSDNSSNNSSSSKSGNGVDDLDISAAVTLGQHQESVAQNAAITRQLDSADVSGDKVVMSFAPLNWPANGVDGSVHLFWMEGDHAVGGYFDAHKAGQTVKGLENVYGGYLGGHKPPAGATVYFCLVNLNNTERTNVKKSQTPW
jgi:hypothetical protein